MPMSLFAPASPFGLMASLILVAWWWMIHPLYNTLHAQEVSPPVRIGEWRSHLSYRPITGLAESPNTLWAATRNGLFQVHLPERRLTTYGTESGISSVNISDIAYDPSRDLIFLLYEDGAMDVAKADRNLSGLQQYSDIKRSDLTGRKAINDLAFDQDWVYVAFGQGIVEYDPVANLTGGNYLNIFPGNDPEVVSVALFEDSIFAAGNNRLAIASLSDKVDRRNPATWRTIPFEVRELTVFQDTLYAIDADEGILLKWNGREMVEAEVGRRVPGTLSGLRTTGSGMELRTASALGRLQKDGSVSIAFNGYFNTAALIPEGRSPWLSPYGPLSVLQGNTLTQVQPNGPARQNAWQLTASKRGLLATAGGIAEPFQAAWQTRGYYQLDQGEWQNVNTREALPNFDVRDLLVLKPDPRMPNVLWGASFTRGIVKINTDTPQASQVFDRTNSSISVQTEAQSFPCNNYPFDCPDFYHRVPDLTFDQNGVLWATNFKVGEPLIARTPEGEWYSFALGNLQDVEQIAVDNLGQIWCTSRASGVAVFNYGQDLENTGDDQLQILSSATGSGNLPSEVVRSLAVDQSGAVWVGTSDGVAVYFSPSLIFSDFNFDAQPIVLTDNNFTGLLLEGQEVNNIAVDGANRKWFATNSGVWVTNGRGDEVQLRFTTENSPLPSDVIVDIALQPESGEAFIATTEGMYSYRTEATEGGQTHGEVLAYPNPVRPEYKGPIAIRGLVRDADVRIADASGRLVTEGQAVGGQFVWNGRDLKGRKVDSGVYLVFSSNNEGTETAVTKILIVR